MTIKIHDLPRIERPREKFERYGPEKLSNAELLSIVLRTGRKGHSVTTIAQSTVNILGKNIIHSQVEDLAKVPGIGKVKAIEIKAAFELYRRFSKEMESKIITSAKDIWDDLVDFRTVSKEHFFVFLLDSRNQLIKRELISIGTLTTSLVHPREVFEAAVKNVAFSIILAHNHPTNVTEPSLADIEVTKRMVKCGNLMGIKVEDHVIIGKDSFCSLKEKVADVFL
jgi:DNA repair protein RadC